MKKTPEDLNKKQAWPNKPALRLITNDSETEDQRAKPKSTSSFVNLMDSFADSLDLEIQKILDL